jgi:putative transposase
MRRSYYEIYLHLVWRTKNSELYLSPDVERAVCNIIQAKCKKFDTALLAVGNTEDHIHMVVSINPNLKISELVAEIKGASSYSVNKETSFTLYWQDGYGCLSIDKSSLSRVVTYVLKQKEHHSIKQGTQTGLEIIDQTAPV